MACEYNNIVSNVENMLSKLNANQKERDDVKPLIQWLNEAKVIGNSNETLDKDLPTTRQNLKESSTYTVYPKAKPDMVKAKYKASKATKYIGYGKAGSSTELYAKQLSEQGMPVNTGKYDEKDVVFVSVNGTPNREDYVNTLKQVIAALESGATVLTDSESYLSKSTYNKGEIQLAKNLMDRGYTRTTDEMQDVGIWVKNKKSSDKTNTVNAKAETKVDKAEKEEDTRVEFNKLPSYKEGQKTMTYAGNIDSVLENTTNPDKFIENSLIKNTVYHYSESGTIDPNLKTNKEEKAIFFFKDRKSAENLQNFLNQGKEDRKGKIFEAKINVQDVEILDASMYDTGSLIDKSIEAKNNSKDAIVAENMTEMGVGVDTQYGVFDIRNVLFTNAEPDEIKLENKPVKKEEGINTSIAESYVKKGSVVKYQSNYYIVKKVNETANNVQLINKNGDSLPGTPGIDKVQFVKQLPIIKFNGVEHIYDEKNDRLYTQNGEKWKDKKDPTRAKIISSAMKEVHNKAITEPVKIVDQIEVKEEVKQEQDILLPSEAVRNNINKKIECKD